MKKIIDLIAPSGAKKDEKLINYIRKKHIKNNLITNICFIYGQENEYKNHFQPSANELRKLVFEINHKNTIYFLASFFFDLDRENYLKLMEDMCKNDIQVFKTDQKKEHITDNTNWLDKYCNFITLEDIENE
ncbi:unknown [Clostridium sp. CAG:798]|nr:unknown [Clostridium sp. CAG:798]